MDKLCVKSIRISIILTFFFSLSGISQIPGSVIKYSKIDYTSGIAITMNSQFGYDVDTMGDLNNDGYNDIVIGAPFASDPGGYDGQMFVIFLDSNKAIKSYTKISRTSGNLNLPSMASGGYYLIGSTICNIGDFNHDGTNDLAMGLEQKNKVFILLMDTNGSVKSSIDIGTPLTMGYFGSDVCTLGDIDNDGVIDLAVGAYNVGVYIVKLNANGTMKSYQNISYAQVGLAQTDNFGAFVQQIGDLDSNGIRDLVVGAHMNNNHTGLVSIIKLNTSYNVLSYNNITTGTPNFINTITSDYFGIGLANMGDINLDGIDDIMVGCPGDDDGNANDATNYGASFTIGLNSVGGVKSYYKIGKTSTNFLSALGAGDDFGFACVPMGDIDNDHKLEFAITSILDDNRGSMHIVTLYTKLTAKIYKTNVKCGGGFDGSATIRAVGGTFPYKYFWSNGDTTETADSLIAGLHYVKVIDAMNDTLIKTILIQEPPKNITIASADTSICFGSCIGISAVATGGKGTKTLYWSNGLGTGNSKNVCPTVNTTYTVFHKDSLNCLSVPDTIIVQINSIPNASYVGLASSYCVNSPSVNLVGTPSGGVFSGLGVTGSTFNPLTAGIGNHQIKYTASINGCIDTSIQQVLVYSNPIVEIIGLSYGHCKNSIPITLTGNPSGGAFSGNGVLNGVFNPSSLISGNHLITYNYTDSFGCGGVDTQSVKVNNNPIANAGNNLLIIPGSSVTLIGNASNGTGIFSYFWTPADSFYYAAVQNATTKPLFGVNQFVLSATDLNTNCVGKDTVSVGMSTIPTTSTSIAIPGIICPGNSSLLNSTTNGGTGAYNYSWSSIPAGFSSNLSDPIVNPVVNTTYILSVTDGFTTDHDTVSIMINPAITVFLGNDTIICGNTSVNLNAGSSATSYLWSTGSTDSFITINTTSLSSGIYHFSVIVANSYGCLSKDTIQLNVSHILPINIGNDTSICSSDSISINAGIGYNSYLWSTGSTNQICTFSMANGIGTHPVWVKVTNAQNCNDIDTLFLDIYPNPVVELGNDTVICNSNPITLIAGNNVGNSYLWSTSQTSNSITIPVSLMGNGLYTYYVRVIASNSCISYDSIKLNIANMQDVNLGNDTMICKTQTLLLNAGVGYNSYMWNNGSTNQLVVVDSTVGIGPQLFHVKVFNDFGCYERDTIVVIINTCIGFDELANNLLLKVYPNPTNDRISIETVLPCSIELLDQSGKCILKSEKQTSVETKLLDISTFSDGVYYLKIVYLDQVYFKKIIKN